jgi:hypothetical protein
MLSTSRFLSKRTIAVPVQAHLKSAHLKSVGGDAETKGGENVFWWFERNGRYMRCEVLQLPSGTFELRVVDPDGDERVERFTDSEELARRQVAVENELIAEGWSGPHGWHL